MSSPAERRRQAGRVVRIVDDAMATEGRPVAAPSADLTGNASGKVYINFGAEPRARSATTMSCSEAETATTMRAWASDTATSTVTDPATSWSVPQVLTKSPNTVRCTCWRPIAAGTINAGAVNSMITGEAGMMESVDHGSMDHNADGIDDFIVDRRATRGGADAGSVYIVYGPVEGMLSLASADLQYTGESAAEAGHVGRPGDVNGDGPTT